MEERGITSNSQIPGFFTIFPSISRFFSDLRNFLTFFRIFRFVDALLIEFETFVQYLINSDVIRVEVH